jgi:RNA polymerase sigma factor (sigma-70 family)
MTPDADLLQRYAQQRDERAFAELVQRHLGLVYAAALRRTGGRVQLAEEISQKIFTELASKAASLCHHPALAGWLYRCTRNAAIDVMRKELRLQRTAQALADMPDTASTNQPVDWEFLRPVLDEAMDELKERDREVMLLRFFQGLTFAEVGEKLSLSENAARMRTERALDKLRGHLGKRGVTSTTAALGLLLANQAFAQAPTGLATSVTTTALAAAPAGTLATFFTNLLMNKIAVTSASAVFAIALTSVAWATLTDRVSDTELAALRAENTSLKEATAPGAPESGLAAVAQETDEQASTLLQSVTKRLQENHAARTSGHSNRGQATPIDAFYTYAWALDTGESEVLENLLFFDEKGREITKRLHASMPASIRAAYPTPEKFVVFLLLAETILNPVKGVDQLADYVATDIEPGHVGLGRKNAKRPSMHWFQTPDGWKLGVPHLLPEGFAKRIMGNEMLDKLGQK